MYKEPSHATIVSAFWASSMLDWIELDDLTTIQQCVKYINLQNLGRVGVNMLYYADLKCRLEFTEQILTKKQFTDA